MTNKKLKPIGVQPHVRPIPRYNKVVLVDDNEMDLFITGTIIKATAIAHEIRQESNPGTMLDFLRNAERLDQVPDLIFLDLKMKEMSGFEFIQEFASLPDFIKNKCKIAVITGSESRNDRHKALMSPSVIRYIVKPVDVYQLKEFMID